MTLSYNWLKQYIAFNLSPQELSDVLTSIGLEVEELTKWQSIKGGLEGVVVGEVKTCQKHPNADKLSITTVDIGKPELLHIVCGAPNVQAGQKVAVATIGTTLYKDNETFTIQKTKIRGELSEGMICAADELGLGNDHSGIMVLNPETPAGTPAANYFKVEEDYIFEVAITPNRIDCASHIGIARNLAAWISQHQAAVTYQLPSINNFHVTNNNHACTIIVENQSACPRYSGISITGVTVTDSPQWLKNKLLAIGLTPINNIVDITNFILHETGQPLHAFDMDKISGKKVIIKNLPENTPFITLDGIERKLSQEDLMICDEKGGMCIAGVFGGIHSGISAETKNVFIESAYFNPVSIRRTAKRHGLSTDASFRFERGTDPEMVIFALKRAAIMMHEIAGGIISSDITDIYPTPIMPVVTNFTWNGFNKLAGYTIKKETIKNILQSLGITILQEDNTGLKLQIPLFMVDVKTEADLAEEILRIYGYNNIPLTGKLQYSINVTEKPDSENIRNQVSNMLCFQGFNEIMNNSLTHSSYYELCGTAENCVKLINPLSNELNVMRQTLLFGGLETILFNINHKKEDLCLFEFGNCYQLKNTKSTNPLDKYYEEMQLALFLYGKKQAVNWATPAEDFNFFHLKGYIFNLLQFLGFKPDTIKNAELNNIFFSEGLALNSGETLLAELGIVNSIFTRHFGIENTVYFAIVYWEKILPILKNHITHFVELPKYPEVKRDLALLLDEHIKFAQIKELALKTERTLLKEITLFDIYKNEKLGHNKKSYAISFTLQDSTKTLTDKEVEKVMNNLIRTFTKELNAQIR